MKSGRGIHIVNENRFKYNKGDVFLLTPNDEHEFVITNRTVFGYLKFTEQLFLEKTELIYDFKWRKKIDAVILHANSIPGSIIKNEQDREGLFQLFHLLKKEFTSPSTHSRSILFELFAALLMIISRNISGNKYVVAMTEKERVNEILTYVQQNVLDSEKIKIAAIAHAFDMSPNYVSVFIKKHAGISIQNYVIQTKIKIAERLLKQSSLNFSEISHKLGFTDSSHFTKTFKKNKGMTPTKFRNK